jgi:hypothetical protein
VLPFSSPDAPALWSNLAAAMGGAFLTLS